MKAVLSWLGGKLVLFLLLAIAIALFQSGIVAAVWHGASSNSRVAEWTNGEDLTAELHAMAAEGRKNLRQNVSAFSSWSADKRSRELQRRRTLRGAIDKALAAKPGLLDRYRPAVILERQRLELEARMLDAEIAVLSAHADRDALKQAATVMVPTRAAVDKAIAGCRAANGAVRAFNARPAAERWVRNRAGSEANRLTAAARQACDRAGELGSERSRGLRKASELAAAIAQAQKLVDDREAEAARGLNSLDEPQLRSTLADIAAKAGLAVVAIILTPYAIRTFLYHVLAPLAARRAAIRMPSPAGGQGAIPPSEPSRVSLSVRLGADEELLVRQGYLQTTSAGGAKSTRWLLDYRYPLTSLASGLLFLTRIRGRDSATTVSATRDGFAELTQIVLPAGAACVLHPRAVVAVIQPLGQAMRIRSHWRLFTLNAWLTMQFRYLSFHGPARLILMGGRGIRVEPAEQGRIFAQEQLVGFSADLAYSVIRTETFAPYLLGREPLLKDKVEAGSGVIVIEEAPLSMRGGRPGGGKGLEGAIDAALKVFGL